MKNTTLKIKCDFSNSATNGRMAKMIGAAPFNPTHETKILSRMCILRNGNNEISTAKGREPKSIKAPINMLINATGNNSSTLTSNPNVRNITI